MAVPVATATLERSAGIVARAFAAACDDAAADATMILHTVHGLSDGADYGRDFAGQNPLVPFIADAASVLGLIARGVTLRAAVGDAGSALVTAADGVATGFGKAAQNLVETLRLACGDPRDAARIFLALAVFDKTVEGGTDPQGMRISGLAFDAAMLMRRSSAIALAKAAADIVPSSQQEAASLAQQVGGAIDQVAEAAADRFDDESYKALSLLRTRVVEDLLQRGASLAPIVARHLPKPLPSLVAAYQLYQDASRAEELVARNNPPHPGFLPLVIESLAQ